ncbi:unnamed protein product [Clonostachys rhizophaga]|uniref:Uncharacterized protein n=1 Tax=Clonostachys rhizophaga TaxID=160324 RepID=A0A9N9YKF1_9HYPO|nr:unnamed protein product [Clonostachys rhizophaga]
MGNPATEDYQPPPYEQATQGKSGPSQQNISHHDTSSAKFACVTLNQHDRIRLINFPADTVTSFQDFLKTAWPKGIQEVRDYGQSREFKLNGYPWYRGVDGSLGPDDTSRLVKKLLEALYNMGWVLHSAVDLRKQGNKDVLAFRRQSPPPPKCEWIHISFDSHDRLTFLEPPSQEIRVALLKTFGRAVSSNELTKDHFEIKFQGFPWSPSGEDTVNTPLKLLKLLETMERFGFSLYSSLMTKNNHEGTDVDDIIMKRQIGKH